MLAPHAGAHTERDSLGTNALLRLRAISMMFADPLA
jgi:hypothetical protein